MADCLPSWKARLRVRFEDYGKARIAAPTTVPTSNALRGSRVDRSPLRVLEELDPQSGQRRFVVGTGLPAQPGAAGQQDSSSDGYAHVVDNVIPRTFDWKQNGIRAPDTLTLTLKWDDFPFDPRAVRSCGVEFYLGTLTPEEFSAGVAGEARFSGPGSGARAALNLVPDTYLRDGQQRTNLRFTGWADDFEMGWSEGEPLVKLNCRDQTQLLITQEHYAGWYLDPALRLDEAIARYLRNYPSFEGLAVEFRPSGSTPPLLKDVYSVAAFPPDKGPPVSKGGAGNEKMSAWDYLTDVVVSLGFIIRLDGLTVVVQAPRNLLNNKARPRSDDPYRGRVGSDGRAYDVRTFIYGENVLELHASRKFARTSTNIEIRAYVPEQKRTIFARAPLAASKRQLAARPGDGKSDQKWTVKVVQGVKDQAQLQQLADSAYEMMNRGELQVSLKTRDMWSFGGENEDPDLLDMRPGDTFELRVKRGDAHSTITERESDLSVFGLGRKELADLGYDEGLALSYERSVTDAGFQRGLLAREVNIGGSVDQGVQLEVVGVNYVEARVDAPPPDPTYPEDGRK